ncbi:hypothetical protein H6P81_001080 [Aristolochia fimbriata]|uniref:IST1-like protein n=1 Tax=Aristolochia fimbriata TaxID=158543 RepID=A0AAV7F9W2_ARIFI|nr:hypothetical protein H6P81_001080 [Aristolochia fimbriata]
MLSRSFKPAKCNTSLRLAVSRIKTLRNRRENQLKQMKRDLAQLLETGQEQTARIRVEHYVREEKTLAAYDIIQIYCELIVARMPIIESQKNCPIDLKEAIASVMFASPRCTDIVELVDVRKHFTAKYGKDFISAALELRPDSGVNRTVVEKLSAKAPDAQSKIRILREIAQEHNVKWDSKAFSDEVSKPSEDLLDGPKKFDSSSKMLAGSFADQLQSPEVQIKSANEQFLARPIQKHDSYSSLPENNVTRLSPSSEVLSSGKGLKPTSSVPTPAHPHSGPSGIRTSRTEDRNSTDDIASHNRHHWDMEFKDAASAAQAAAESAEMASLAARAAAQLSRLEKSATQSPTEDHRSYFEPRNEKPVTSTGSKSKPRGNAMKIRDDSADSFYRMQTGQHNSPKDRLKQGHISRGAESGNDQHKGVTRTSNRSVSSRSSVTSIDDEIADNYLQKADLHNISPIRNYTPYSNMHSYPNSDRAPAGVVSSLDANDHFEQSPANVGYRHSERMNEQPGFGDSASAVFDQSGSEDEDHVEQESDYSRQSSFPFQENKVLFHPSPKVDSWSPSQQVSRSFFSEPTDQSSKDLAKNSVPFEAKDCVPARFDDSDGFSSENEAVGDHTIRGSFFLSHEEEIPSAADDTESADRNSLGVPPSRFSSTKKEKDKDQQSEKRAHNLESTDRKMSGSSLLMPGKSFSSQTSYVTPNPYNEEGRVNKKEDFLYTSSDDSESDDGHVMSKRSSRLSSTQEVRDLGKEHSSLHSVSSEISSESSHNSENRLNFGHLTGGLRNKGLTRPPYVRSTSKEEPKNEIAYSEAARLSQSEMLFAGHEPQEMKLSNLKTRVDKELNSKGPISDSESDNDDAEKIRPHRNFNARGPEGRIVSRRTRDSPLKSVSDDPSRLTGWSRDAVHSGLNEGSKASQVGSSSKPQVPSVASGPKYNSPRTGSFLKQEPKQHPQVVIPVEKVEDSQKVLTEKAGARETASFLNSESDVRGREGRFVSRRTRDSPLKSTSDGPTGFAAWSKDPVHSSLNEGSKASQVGSSSKPQVRSVASGSKDNSSRIDTFLEQETKHPRVDKAGASEIPSSQTARVSSRESSLKGASHVHPKLPDYDSLAAHFENLRANQR